jgi:predicted DNA-binding transcriptional regulator YafY
MRGEQLARQWRILNLLQNPAGRRFDEMADELGVTERTVRRDVESLELAGFPIYDEQTDDRGKVWKIDKDWLKLPPISFSANEVLALYFAEKMLGGIQGAGFEESISSLLGKVNAVLPEDNKKMLASIADRMITSQKVSTLSQDVKG